MSKKSMIMLGMTIGTVIGGYLPMIFGASSFSITSLITAAIGGLIGIYITYKLIM